MILDSGRVIFLWIGPKASQIEVKFAGRAALMYREHLKIVEKERPRKISAALKGREPREFTRCFHAWSKHKTHAVEAITR